MEPLSDPEFERLLKSLPEGFLCPVVEVEGYTVPLVWKLPNPPTPNEPNLEYAVLKCRGDGNCLFHALLRAVKTAYIRSFETPLVIKESTLTAFEKELKRKLTFPSGTLYPDRNVIPSEKYQIVDKKEYEKVMRDYRIELVCNFRADFAHFVLYAPEVVPLIRNNFETSIEVETAMLLDQNFPKDRVDQQALQNVRLSLAQKIANQGEAIEPDVVILISHLYNYDIYLLSENKLKDPRSKDPFAAGFFLSAVLGPQDMRLENNPNKNLPNRQAIVLTYSGGVLGHYDLVVKTTATPRKYVTLFSQDEPLIVSLYLYLSIYRHSL